MQTERMQQQASRHFQAGQLGVAINFLPLNHLVLVDNADPRASPRPSEREALGEEPWNMYFNKLPG